MAWKLTREVILQEPRSTKGRSGSAGTTTYTDHVTRAALLASAGGEQLNVASFTSEHRRTFVIRYHPDINSKWRIVFNEFAHDIKAVDEIPGSGRNRFLKIVCEVGKTNRTQQIVRETGPQPLYGITTQDMVGAISRQNINVASAGSEIVPQPVDGTLNTVDVSVADATPSGKYIIFLFPQAWGNPTAFYYRGSTVFNQIGGFRFVPANLIGSTSEFSSRYTAMVSNNRKLTDTPVTGQIVWDLR